MTAFRPRFLACGVWSLLQRLFCAALFLLATEVRAPAQGSVEAQRLIAEGVRLLRGGQVEAAKQQLDQGIALSPDAADALTWRGIAENQLSQYAAAAADFRRALQLNDGLLAAHYNLALSLVRLHQPDAAIEEFKKVVAAQPDAPDVSYNLGILLEDKGLHDEAAEAFAQAHTLRPGDPENTLHLLRARLAARQQTGMAALLLELNQPATDPALQQQAGIALLEAGRFADAIRLLQSAKNHGVSTPDSDRLLARALIGAGKGSDAVALMQEQYDRDPADTARGLDLARVLLAADQADQASALLARLPETPAESTQREVLTGVALAATHEVPKAVEHLEKAVRADPSLSLANSVLGFCRFQQGDYGAAAMAYQRASDLDPGRRQYARDAAVAYERANQPDQALRFAERANATGGASAADHLLLGKLLLRSGRTQEAIEQLRRAAAINPDLDAADYLLARAYAQLGQRQQAATWANKLSEIKQRHEAAFLSQKQASSSPAPVRSSTLLQGGVLDGEQATAP